METKIKTAIDAAIHYCDTCDALAGVDSGEAQSMRRRSYAEMAEALKTFRKKGYGAGVTPVSGL